MGTEYESESDKADRELREETKKILKELRENVPNEIADRLAGRFADVERRLAALEKNQAESSLDNIAQIIHGAMQDYYGPRIADLEKEIHDLKLRFPELPDQPDNKANN